jgi:anti-anti-sigma factor
LLTFPLSIAPPAGAELTLTGVTTDRDSIRLAFAGEVDMSNAAEFAEAVATRMDASLHRRVCIDFARVRFLDSAGIKALLDGQRRARQQGRELIVVDMHPSVRRVLEITAVLDLLTGA